jgi:hypothetical protein
MNFLKKTLVFIFLLSSHFLLSGQEEFEILPRSTIVFLDNQSELEQEAFDIVMESFLIQAGSANEYVNLIYYGELPSQEKSKLLETTVLSGGDSYILLTLSGSLRRLEYVLSMVDVNISDDIFTISGRSRIDSRYRVLLTRYWNDAVANIEAVQGISPAAELTIRALPGTAVSIRGRSEEYQMSDSGSLEVDLPAPASYAVRFQLEGHYTENIIVYLDKKGAIAEVEQSLLGTIVLESGLNHFAFPYISAHYFILPETISLGVSYQPYFLGLSPFLNQEAEPSLFASFNLHEIQLIGKWYINGVTAPVRYQIGLNTTIRIIPEFGQFIDPIFPIALGPNTSVELALNRNMFLGITWSPQFYLTTLDTFGMKSFLTEGYGGTWDVIVAGPMILTFSSAKFTWSIFL